MVAIPMGKVGSVTKQVGSVTGTGILALAVALLYLLLAGYCSLAITLLQIRQQVGPSFDTLVELSRAQRGTDKLEKEYFFWKGVYAGDSAEDRKNWAKEEGRIGGEQKILKEQKSLLQQRLKELEKDETRVAALTARMNAIADFLDSPYAGWMATMPSDFVVLFLAMMMGALGGALGTLCKLVEEGVNPSPSDYFLRPALGFLVAIAVFVLFKAGQLVISSNTNSQADTLNPFLIGFIGVVSGLVANQAVASVQRAGTSFFTTSGDRKPVYARELLGQKMEGLSQAETAMLLSLLKIDPKDLDDWKTEKRPIPKQGAEVLSAFFRTNGRDLFAGEPKADTPQPSPAPPP